MTPQAAQASPTDAPRIYTRIQLLTGAARGAWGGIYAWFLNHYLHLDAAQVSFLVNVQFLLQIILEVPSGIISEKAHRPTVVSLSYICFAFYALCYVFAGLLQAASGAGDGSSPVLAAIASLAEHGGTMRTLGLAAVAELFFGIGSAFLSGTLDGWIAENRRQASRDDAEEFKREMARVAGLKVLTSNTPRAVLGGCFLWVAVRPPAMLAGEHATGGGVVAILPWALAFALYVGVAIYAWLALQRYSPRRLGIIEGLRDTSKLLNPFGDLFELLQRYSYRASSFISESPVLIRVFAWSSLAFVLFWSAQVFWLIFFTQFVAPSSGATGAAGEIPALVLLWAGGEFSQALGGSSWVQLVPESVRSSLARRFDTTKSGRSTGVWLLLYGAAMVAQGGAAFVDRRTALGLFAVGYLASKFLEGRVRADLSVLTDRAIVSERVTHQSIDALIKSLFGLVFVSITGLFTRGDPVNGVAFLALIALVAGALFLFAPFSNAQFGSAPLRAAARAPAAGAGSRRRWRVAIALSAGLGLLVAAFQFAPDASLVGQVSTRVSAAHIVLSDEGTHRPWPERSADSGEHSEIVVRTWRAWAEGTSLAECRLDLPAKELEGCSFSGVTRQRVQSHEGTATVRFALEQGRDAVISTRDAGLRPFSCLDAAGGVLPMKYDRGSTTRTNVDGWVLLELLVGAACVAVLFAFGENYSRTVTERVQGFATQAMTLKANHDELATSLHPGQELLSVVKLHSTRLEDVLSDFFDESTVAVGSVDLAYREGWTGANLWCVLLRASGGLQAQAHGAPPWVREHVLTTLRQIESLEACTEHRISLRLTGVDSGEAATLLTDWPGAVSRSDGQGPLDPIGGEGQLWAATRLEGAENGRKVLSFAIVIDGELPAERYVDPIERWLLRTLAEVAGAQHRTAHYRFGTSAKLHDTFRWLGRVLRQLDHAVALAESPDESSPTAVVGTLKSLRTLTRADAAVLADWLGRKLPGHEDILSLQEQLERERDMISTGSRTSTGGFLKLNLEWQGGSVAPLAPRAWTKLRRVLHELAENAARYGCDEERQDVDIEMQVRAHDGTVSFSVRNWAPAETSVDSGEHRTRFGLKGAAANVVELGGQWLGATRDGAFFVVTFALPAASAPHESRDSHAP